MKSLQAAGQFTDRKVAFEEIADDRIAREVAKELGYKIPVNYNIPYSRFQIGCTEILLRPVIWNMEFAIWN